MLEHIYEIIESTQVTNLTAIVKLLCSFFLGALIGAERQFRRHDAGIRTFTLICMGSTAAMLTSIWIPQTYPNFLNGDPGRIAAQVLSGIGFLGAGAIIQSKGSIRGLTTAACIWIVAVIGLAVGAGMYIAAMIATALTLFVLISLEQLEKRVWLDGVNKILTISCNKSSPDLEAIKKILAQSNVYIVSVSFENDYVNETALISYKVHVKTRGSYDELFLAIRSLGYVTQIKLLA